MQQLFETWWYGYLVIPLGITVFVGGFIAIWIGVFIARRVAFDQTRTSACHALYKMTDLADSKSPGDYSDRLYNITQALIIATTQSLSLRQDGLSSHLHYVCVRLNESPWSIPKSFPLEGNARHEFIDSIQPWTKIWSNMVFNVRPDWYALFTLQGQVTSAYTVKCIPLVEMKAAEQASIEAVNRHDKERRLNNVDPASAARKEGLR